jgi:hypothetical protein
MQAAGPQVLDAVCSPRFDVRGQFREEATAQAFSDKARNKLVDSLASLEKKIAARLRELGKLEEEIEWYNHVVLRGRYMSLLPVPNRGGSDGSSINAPENPEEREFITLTRSVMREDPRPIDETCSCYTCTGTGPVATTQPGLRVPPAPGRHYSRSYLHHLFKTDNSLAGTLVTIHNVHFMNRMMADIRAGIREGRLNQVEATYGVTPGPE